LGRHPTQKQVSTELSGAIEVVSLGRRDIPVLAKMVDKIHARRLVGIEPTHRRGCSKQLQPQPPWPAVPLIFMNLQARRLTRPTSKPFENARRGHLALKQLAFDIVYVYGT
jgi:hypothetical protein